jgi:hypothetical protein
MRTKTLLLTAALCAAGIATSMAQSPVYSVNAVGYVNTPLVKGYNLVANPLDNKAPDGNKIKNLFSSLPPGSQIFLFDTATQKYALATVDEFSGAVEGPAADQVLTPGHGVFIQAPVAGTITFVGEVPQGSLSVDIPAGFSIRASQVPQAGTATSLQFPAADGDQIFIFDEATQKYKTSNYDFGAWDVDPAIDVGEAFFVRTSATKNWQRSFSVNG